MKRELWSANRFDERLAALFEKFEDRADDLETRYKKLVKDLLDGRVTKAPQHHPTDDTCFLTHIDDYVVVFRPDVSKQSGGSGREGDPVIEDLADASNTEFLAPEKEP